MCANMLQNIIPRVRTPHKRHTAGLFFRVFSVHFQGTYFFHDGLKYEQEGWNRVVISRRLQAFEAILVMRLGLGSRKSSRSRPHSSHTANLKL